MAPEADINRLLAQAVTSQKFRERLLDPKTRAAALEEVTEAVPKGRQAISLTQEERGTLLAISETDLASFAKRCIAEGLTHPSELTRR